MGLVLESYDKDRNYPTYGFGAILPPASNVSHCFPLNGNFSNPEVPGIRGILEAYRHTLSTVRLSGPTLFAPIINAAAQVGLALVFSSLWQYTQFCIKVMFIYVVHFTVWCRLPPSQARSSSTMCC